MSGKDFIFPVTWHISTPTMKALTRNSGALDVVGPAVAAQEADRTVNSVRAAWSRDDGFLGQPGVQSKSLSENQRNVSLTSFKMRITFH